MPHKNNSPFPRGARVEIPVHYDMWMRGARTGTVGEYRRGRHGQSAYVLAHMDHRSVTKPLKLWEPDWEYAKLL